jgi:hypothetical protein
MQAQSWRYLLCGTVMQNLPHNLVFTNADFILIYSGNQSCGFFGAQYCLSKKMQSNLKGTVSRDRGQDEPIEQ